MSYVQIQSTLTVLIELSFCCIPVLFVAYIAGLAAKVKATKVPEQEPEVAIAEVPEQEPEVAIAEVPEVEPEVQVAEVQEVEPEVQVAEVQEVEPEVQVAEVQELEPEVQVAEVLELDLEFQLAEVQEVEPEDLENLMVMLDRINAEIESSIHAWFEGSELLTLPMEVEEARLRFKQAEDLVVSTETLGDREVFKVQKIGRKYVYALNFEGEVCKFALESVKFWSA